MEDTTMPGEFNFEITEKIAVLSTDNKGWSKELNKVSYNGFPPKYDLRSWDENHERMGKGITLNDDEMQVLKDALVNREI